MAPVVHLQDADQGTRSGFGLGRRRLLGLSCVANGILLRHRFHASVAPTVGPDLFSNGTQVWQPIWRSDETAFFAEGERSGLSIYINDFLEMQVLMEWFASAREGMVSSHQGTIRISYSDSGVARNEPKTVQSASVTEHVGYLLDGKSVWVGLTTSRLLEIIAIGLHLVGMARCPLLFLQVFAGKTAHALQVRRPLWSFLFHFWKAFQAPELTHVQRCLTASARREVLGLICCLPLCGTCVNGDLDRVVTCSDASESRLGVSRSVGINAEGWRLFRHLYATGEGQLTPLPNLKAERASS